MTALAGIGYLLIAFSPALVIFRRIIASDPLRVILFILGAFFWLLSLLLSACVWFAVVPLREHIVFAVMISVALQEGARLLHFILLKKAQKGLNRMSSNDQKLAGVHALQHARHMLAVVCGLGMGVMASLFLIINVIADFWGSGTVGLPASVPQTSDRFTVKLLPDDQNFAITYSISACMLTLCHVFWTVLFWDGCQKRSTTSTWWLGVCFAVLSHYAISALSFGNRTKYQAFFMCMQGVVLVADGIASFAVMGVTVPMLQRTSRLAFLRLLCVFGCEKETADDSNRGSENFVGNRSDALHVDN
ncbi:unnamed protein product [Thelazia callipaeda]|uniref:Gamma-secretase subunit Aph-1 n=1 Tax=Thelazia callipaeda TaxID=103827 RepID=A0A0N5D083_THECL|nr:unnamed protein product [Thelazia callipaeda]